MRNSIMLGFVLTFCIMAQGAELLKYRCSNGCSQSRLIIYDDGLIKISESWSGGPYFEDSALQIRRLSDEQLEQLKTAISSIDESARRERLVYMKNINTGGLVVFNQEREVVVQHSHHEIYQDIGTLEYNISSSAKFIEQLPLSYVKMKMNFDWDTVFENPRSPCDFHL